MAINMKELLRELLYCVYRFMPKWNHAIIWGWPTGEDSSRQLVEHLQYSVVKKVILLVDNVEQAHLAFPCPGQKTVIVTKDSIRGWLWFLFAKYVFFTHRCYMRKFPPNVVSVNLWHGMPLKKVGNLLCSGKSIASKYAVAPSEFWREIMQESMGPWNGVLTTGLPRNDRLFMKTGEVRQYLDNLVGHEVKSIIAWLPTYRQSIIGEIRDDGQESGSVFGLRNLNNSSVLAFARAHNALIWVKPHPMATRGHVEEHDHLLIIDDAWILQHGLSLYGLLGASNVLISDISGAYVDYLILDRPIIHCFPDMMEYRNSRGFSVEPVENYLSGPLVRTWDALETAITQILDGDDPYSEQRRSICKLFHKYQDDASTERLLRAIGL